MDITPYLKEMVETNGSDLFFTVGAPPYLKVGGQMKTLSADRLLPGSVKKMAYSMMSQAQVAEFERELEMNFAISLTNIGRFRVNVFMQRGESGMVIRFIKRTIPTLEELQLPQILQSLIMEVRGLILLVGATGTGKSTTLASMIDHRNSHLPGHILTIEDPIEYLHKHKLSIVNQREVGLDTLSYAKALKNAMREAPDVILIGEIRDQETMQHALSYAETGHLCLATLHANNANQALDRVIHFFPENNHAQVFNDLSLNLRGIVSQRLIPAIAGHRIAAVEVLLNTPYIADLISKGDVHEIKSVMEKNQDQGMQTFDQALYQLYQAELITQEEALKHADSRNNLALLMRLDDPNMPLTSGELSMVPQEQGRL